MADVNFRVTRTLVPTVTGTQDITISGFGTPKGAIVILNKPNTDDTIDAGAVISIGMTDGTNYATMGGDDEDGQSTTDSQSSLRTSWIVLSTDDHSANNKVATSSFIADGIRLNWTNVGNQQDFLTVVLIGGADIGVKVGSNTTGSPKSITGVGFQPTAILVASAFRTSDGLQADLVNSFGFSNGTNQGNISYTSDGAQSTTATYTRVSSNEMLSWTSTAGADSGSATLTSFDADGFTIDSTIGSARFFGYMVLDIHADHVFQISNGALSNTTGTQIVFPADTTPDFNFGIMSDVVALDDTITNGVSVGFHVTDSSANYSSSISSEQGVTTSVAKSLSSSNIACLADDGTLGFSANTPTLTSGGVQANVTTASSGRYLSFAVTPVPPVGLVADNGSFSLTGTDVNFSKSYINTAESGSFSLTGTDVNFLSGKVMAVSSGSYTYTGTQVGLSRGYPIVIDSGSYIETGTPTSLTAQRKLTLDSGTFTLSGTGINFQTGKSLSAGTGSFVLSGTTANLITSRTLTSDTGSFSLSGADISMSRGFTLPLNSGAYSITGTDLTTSVARVLIPDLGEITLTGTDIGLSFTKTVVAENGTITLTGTAVSLVYSGAPLVTASGERLISVDLENRIIKILTS